MQVAAAAANMFWHRWRKEYLPTLIQRQAWYRNSKNVKLVIIQSENIPRSHWSLGHVIETYPGKGGIIRTVKVKMPNNKLVIPCRNLCLPEKNFK